MIFSVDAETHSPVNLVSQGSDAYTRHPETRCLMLAFHPIGDPSTPDLWLEGQPAPAALCAHVRSGGSLAGWNVIGFDRGIWDRKLVPLHGFPPAAPEQWVDSMHRAAAANLPRSLDGCAKAVGMSFEVGLKDQNRIRRITNAEKNSIPATVAEIFASTPFYKKDKRGDEYIDCFVTPDGVIVSCQLMDDLRWLADRCIQDVVLEEGVLVRLPPWPAMEPWLRMPAIDRRINDRGVLMDVPLVQGLARAATIETARLDVEIAKLTDGEVPKTTNIESLKAYLVKLGVELPANDAKPRPGTDDGDAALEVDSEDEETEASRKSPWKLRKNDIADLLARTDVPDKARMALALRGEASKASVRKLRKMLSSVGEDGRLRGTMALGGAQQTMRWASPGVNLYNTVRDVFGNPDEIAATNGLDAKKDKAEVKRLGAMALRTAIEVGRSGDPDLMRMLYETTKKDAQGRSSLHGVLMWISRMTRRTLSAPTGYMLLNGDFAQVEARITVWLAGQLDMLSAFANRDDVYKIAAAGIFGVDISAVTKEMRQIGKVTILACIGEGSLVLTDKGMVPIEQVSVDDKVWDGVEWVSHDGPVFMGWQDTITYDGLEATADHKVYVEGQEGSLAHSDAASGQIPLARSGDGRTPIRLGRDNRAGSRIRDGFSRVRGDEMHELRVRAVDVLVQSDERQEQRLSDLHAAQTNTASAGSRNYSPETALRKLGRSCVQALRSARDSVQFSVNNRSGVVGAGKPRSSLGAHGDRPDRQQRSLRAGQPAVGYPTAADAQHAVRTGDEVQRRINTQGRCAPRSESASAARSVRGPDYSSVSSRDEIGGGSPGAAGSTACVVQTRRPVWDLLNAGPRHRFTVSGRLVSNCGFGGGPNALTAMGYNYGVLMSTAEATPIVKGYRNSNKFVNDYWYATDDAAANAVRYPGSEFPVAPYGLVSYLMQGDCLCCRLPSGRMLRYWQPRLEQEYWSSGQPKDRMSLSGIAIKGRSMFRRSLYHTILMENQVQAIAADMLGHCLDNVEKAGLPAVLHVYDSVAAETIEDRADDNLKIFEQCMLDMPAWTQGLPTAVDADYGARFG